MYEEKLLFQLGIRFMLHDFTYLNIAFKDVYTIKIEQCCRKNRKPIIFVQI